MNLSLPGEGFLATKIAEITIGQAIGGSLLTSAVTGGIGALMTGAQKAPAAPAMPEIKSPPVMPAPDDEAAMAARRKRVAEISARSGRESTFLTDEGDRLGAG